MKPCPECDADVSDAARACPNCGHPFGRPIGVQLLIGLFWMAAIFVIGWLVFAIIAVMS